MTMSFGLLNVAGFRRLAGDAAGDDHAVATPQRELRHDGFGILEEGSHYPQITQITPIPSIVLCNRCNLWMNYRFCV
jgi:hypothetical protein